MPTLVQIPVLRDNTVWMLVNETAHGKDALVVDPPETKPVLDAIAHAGATLRAILCTHHHADHVGANVELAAMTGAIVVGNGADRARIPALTDATAPGARVDVIGLSFRVLDVAAHTRAHIAYALDTPVDTVVRHGHDGAAHPVAHLAHRPVLFVGDALFLGGCGRLFEGTPDDLVRALSTLSREDPRALVCCAHEYTMSNLAFACALLDDDEPSRTRRDAAHATLAREASTLPGTLDEERRTNVFLRVLDDDTRPRIARSLGLDDGASVVDVMGALRSAKDVA
jgi:hydroxyacylglutathione hydrolase